MHPDPEAAMDLRDLAHGEHLVVWTFRAFAAGRRDCPLMAREYRGACGEWAAQARAAMEVFAQQLQLQGRRTVELGRPGVLTLTRDEQLLLAIFTAAQRGAIDRCQAHLTWLLARPAPALFHAAASVVARALAASGHHMGVARAPEPQELEVAPRDLIGAYA